MHKYNQHGKGYYLDLNENIAGVAGVGSYEKGAAPFFVGELSRDMQTGGKPKYNYIVNPLTNRKCNINSSLGRKILQNYYNNLIKN